MLDLRLALPKEMGGPGGALSTPEQLFAAGYAACFDSALSCVAAQRKQKLPSNARHGRVPVELVLK